MCRPYPAVGWKKLRDYPYGIEEASGSMLLLSSPKAMRILIADDSECVRRSTRELVESQDGWRICGEVETGLAAIEKTQELKPDIVILDISMPVLSGFAAAKVIKELSPDTAVLFYSLYYSEAYLKEALRIGVEGYVSKSDDALAILSAIDAAQRRAATAKLDAIS